MANVSAAKGDVALDVFGNLDGVVTAGGGSAAGKVIAARVRGETKKNLTASGSVMLWSFAKISGNISGGGTGATEEEPQDTTVVTWAALEGSVAGGLGGVGLFAHGDISDTISGAGEIYVATWGSLLSGATVTGNGVDKPVEVFSRHNVSDDVSSEGSLTVTAGDDITGNMTAGTDWDHDASVSALGVGGFGNINAGSAGATISAGGSATVFAKGDVGGSISGTAGHASVIARGSFVGSVTAGVDATLATGNNITNATVDAGRDANVSAHGDVLSTRVVAEQDASLWAKGTITFGSVFGGGTASSGAYQAGSASISSLSGMFFGTAKAGDDVSLYSGGALTNATEPEKVSGTFDWEEGR